MDFEQMDLRQIYSNYDGDGLRKPARIATVILALAALFFAFVLPQLAGQGHNVSVKVLSAQSGLPIDGATVLVINDGNIAGFKLTRPSGEIEFNNFPKTQKTKLAVEAPGFARIEISPVKDENFVELPFLAFNAQTRNIQPPASPIVAFNGSSSVQNGLENLITTTPNDATQQAPAPTQTDCAQITPDENPTPTASGTSNGQDNSTTNGQTAENNQTNSSTTTPTNNRTNSTTPVNYTSTANGTRTEISMALGQTTTIGGGANLSFEDYSAAGSARFLVTLNNGDSFRITLSQQEKSAEIGAVNVTLERLGLQPTPVAFLTLTGKNFTLPQGDVAQKLLQTVLMAPASPTASIAINIVSPQEDTVISGKTAVWGTVVATNGVFGVQVSADGGATWEPARGGKAWTAELSYSTPGKIGLMAKATDCKGNTNSTKKIDVWGSSCRAISRQGRSASKYDVVFIPANFGDNFDKFSSQAQDAIEYAFSIPPVNTPAYFSKFNFYFFGGEASCKVAGDKPPENRAWKCDLPQEYYESCPFADLAVVLVDSSMRAGRSGNPIVASAGEKQILLHELSHSVFGLADEYCCDGGYWEGKPVPNIFKTKEKCEQNTTQSCAKIGSANWWHPSIEKGLMEALEKNFYDKSDLPLIEQFNKKYE